MSSSRKKISPSKVYKMQQSIIFRRTSLHHEQCLKEMFRKHYKPTVDGKENKYWTLNLSEKTMEELRVHLSWVMHLNVFEWDRENIGHQIFVELQEDIIVYPVEYDYILC